MSEELPDRVEKGFVSVPDRLKALNETEYFAVLATDNRGQPYTSLIAYAVTPDAGKVVFSTTRKTRKYKNILSSGLVAILIDNRPKDEKALLQTEAITVLGKAKPLRRGKRRDELARVFLHKHPDFSDFVGKPATVLIEVEITQCVHVGRFQTISVWDCGK